MYEVDVVFVEFPASPIKFLQLKNQIQLSLRVLRVHSIITRRLEKGGLEYNFGLDGEISIKSAEED